MLLVLPSIYCGSASCTQAQTADRKEEDDFWTGKKGDVLIPAPCLIPEFIAAFYRLTTLRGAVAASGLEIVHVRFVGFAIFGQHGLAIVVARLPGLDMIGQDVSHRRRLPDPVFP